MVQIVFAVLEFAATSILLNNGLMRPWGEMHLMDQSGRSGVHLFLLKTVSKYSM